MNHQSDKLLLKSVLKGRKRIPTLKKAFSIVLFSSFKWEILTDSLCLTHTEATLHYQDITSAAVQHCADKGSTTKEHFYGPEHSHDKSDSSSNCRYPYKR